MPTLTAPLKINGVISTDKTVLQNLNDICNACSAFLTFDISQGKWAVVINTTGASIKNYNNSNIIGSITVTETGVGELYNDVRIEFPHKSLRDQTDFVEVSIPAGSRFVNEIDNQLQIQTSLVNDPVQAQYLASVELKQSRLNKIVNFTTDYTSLGLKAGDLIDVTSDIYGFTAKVFRVIKLEEVDDDVIGINITAMEYDANVYSTAGLEFKERTKKTGILLKQQNDTLKELDDAGVAGSIGRMIAANAGLGIVNSLLNKLFGRKQIGTDANGNPIFSSQTEPANQAAAEMDKVLGSAKKPALQTITRSASVICEASPVVFTVGHTCSVCLFDIPEMTYPYSITGVLPEDITIPLTGTVTVANGTGTLVVTTNAGAGGAVSQIMSVTIGGLNTSVEIFAPKDFTYAVASSAASITEGQNVDITLTTTGSKLNSTIPYAITGTATGKVSTPLTGNVTASAGTANLTVVTTDDAIFQGTQSLLINFDADLVDPCGTVGVRSISVTVLDNDVEPPPPVPTTTCSYITVPVVWCGVYNGTDQQLQEVTVRRSALLPVPLAGEATILVPTSLTVTKGNPSTITVATTTAVAASADLGGLPFNVLTSFNDVGPLGLITGSHVEIYGYNF
jgi:hypothetical protein